MPNAGDHIAVVDAFLSCYQAHDVDGLAKLCAIDAEFTYVPVEMSGKQRVLRGRGKVGDVGKAIWAGLFASFPDLSLTVRSIDANEEGAVVVQAAMAGTHERAWGFSAPAGRPYREPSLFVFRVEDNLIRSITAYWNDASVSQQLGHREVD